MASKEIERFSEELHDPFLGHEHAHRYWWARQLCSGKRVLDIASGSGFGSYILASTASSVCGVDISAEAVEYGAKHYKRHNLAFRTGDCTSITFTELFDVVVSFETIEHLSDSEQQKFLDTVGQALAPNGVLIVSTPNIVEYAHVQNPFHRHELTLTQFKEVLAGKFKQVSIYGQRMLPGSWICPVRDGALDASAELVFQGISHSDTVTKIIERPAFQSSYFIAMCSNSEVRGPGENSFLADTSFRLYIDSVKDMPQPDALQRDLDLVKIELQRQIDRLSQALNDSGAFKGETQSDLESTKGRISRIEEELFKQIQRISGLESIKDTHHVHLQQNARTIREVLGVVSELLTKGVFASRKRLKEKVLGLLQTISP